MLKIGSLHSRRAGNIVVLLSGIFAVLNYEVLAQIAIAFVRLTDSEAFAMLSLSLVVAGFSLALGIILSLRKAGGVPLLTNIGKLGMIFAIVTFIMIINFPPSLPWWWPW